MKIDISPGSIFPTNNYGNIEIIEDLGNSFEDRKHRRFKVKFLNSGNIKIVRKDSILSGSIKDEIHTIDFEKIRSSYACGKFKIIEYIGLCNGRQYVKIKFLDSEAESIVLLSNAENGKVHDPMFGYNPKKIFQSNRSGPFKMIEYLGKENGHAFVMIQFINTGHIRKVEMYNALDGKVSDKTLNGIISTDFSIDRFDNYENYLNNRLKSTYAKMISRCYNVNSKEYQFYGALGVKVCNEWLENVDIFLQDVKTLPGYDKYYYKPFIYELDKDYLQFNIPKENRIYSKETCMFLHKQDNLNLKAIEYKRDFNPNGYFGVHINSANNFQVGITVKGKYIYLGTFSNIIAAANMFNIAFSWYHEYEIVPLVNDVPFMQYNEIFKYKINPKQLYTLL